MLDGEREQTMTVASYYWGSYGLQVSVLHPKITIFVPGVTTATVFPTIDALRALMSACNQTAEENQMARRH